MDKKIVEMSEFTRTIMEHKYSHDLGEEGIEGWGNIAYRATKHPMKAIGYTMRDRISQSICKAITDRKFLPAGRYLYASGRPYHQVQNCLLLGAFDSREGWSDLLQKSSMALMTGAGIGVEYSDIRAEGAKIRKTGGKATGPIALMQMLNECGRGIMQGGSRRSAIWAGLRWDHPDVHKFIHIKDWSDAVLMLKKEDFNFPATLDCTNISVGLNDDFFAAYGDREHERHALANGVYWDAIKQMLITGEPGFSVNCGKSINEILRNACTEVTSSTVHDICNLGSLNLARIESIEEFTEMVELGTIYLLAGTLYSDVPYPEVDQVRTKNRRLGLGLMGVHEWLLKRGKPYAPDDELWQWLQVYMKSTKIAHQWADKLEISRPKKTRAIAPTGTISIIAETTSGIEPIFCVAYKRRYLKHKSWHYQYVIDPTAQRLIKSGIHPETIEDAYDLSRDVERRVNFQHWMQQAVDHGISSTINLPHWGSEENNNGTIQKFGEMLIKYLPGLRGITCYPDGARDGQPLVPVLYEEAMKHTGTELIEEATDSCNITKGGSCGE